VLDSSTSAAGRRAVSEVCADFDFTSVHFHDGPNLAAARNACAKQVAERLIINVDDDIQVEPDALERLVIAYSGAQGARVVAGSVAWDGVWSRPVTLGRRGWGRFVANGEAPDFLIGALCLYPKALAVALPWHERRLRGPRNGLSDDRYIGALWRRKGVALLYEPKARAIHHHEHTTYGLPDQPAHVYTNLVQALVGSQSLARAASFEVLGFLQALKTFMTPATAREMLGAWAEAHVAFVKDWAYLQDVVSRDLPTDGW
jgi:hypothetical protein